MPIRAALCPLVVLSIGFGFAAGCLKVEVSPSVTSPESYRAAPDDPNMTYAPYAYELRAVLNQQSTIASELRKRDWEELADEIGDWRDQIRRLRGVADTSDDPALMRQLCDELQQHVRTMDRGQRARDAKTVQDALDGASAPLDRLSSEFPLVQRKDAAEPTD